MNTIPLTDILRNCPDQLQPRVLAAYGLAWALGLPTECLPEWLSKVAASEKQRPQWFPWGADSLPPSPPNRESCIRLAEMWPHAGGLNFRIHPAATKYFNQQLWGLASKLAGFGQPVFGVRSQFDDQHKGLWSPHQKPYTDEQQNNVRIMVGTRVFPELIEGGLPADVVAVFKRYGNQTEQFSISGDEAPHNMPFHLARVFGLPTPVVFASERYFDSMAGPQGHKIYHTINHPAMASRTLIERMTPDAGSEFLSALQPVDMAPLHYIVPPQEAQDHKTPRWLNADVMTRRDQQLERVKAFRRDMKQTVVVWVGLNPPDGDHSQPHFPDELLPRRRDGDWVRVILTEASHLPKAKTKWMKIPPQGASLPVEFPLPMLRGSNVFDARVLICRGSRILQTAKLRGPVLAADADATPDDAFRFDIEAVIEADLSRPDHPSFDASFIINDSHCESQLTGIHDAGVHISALSQDDKQFLADLQAMLNSVVSKEFSELEATPQDIWYKLAHQGSRLFKQLKSHVLDIESVKRVQLISADPYGLLPLEYVYTLRPPDKPRLCPQASLSLHGGRCANCTAEMQEQAVCPLGFWGVTNIIERHIFNPGSPVRPPSGYTLTRSDNTGRHDFGPIDSVLIGKSDIVEEIASGRKAWEKLSKNLPKRVRKYVAVEDWDKWRSVVASNKPQVLVLLSHTKTNSLTSTAELYIVKGSRLMITQVDEREIGDSDTNTIVMLLGCSTADTVSYCHDTHTSFFSAGANIVVGTLSMALGAYAVEAAEEIIEKLTAPDRLPTMGDIILGTRRSLLAKGRLLGLSIIAFGDADWTMGMQ